MGLRGSRGGGLTGGLLPIAEKQNWRGTGGGGSCCAAFPDGNPAVLTVMGAESLLSPRVAVVLFVRALVLTLSVAS